MPKEKEEKIKSKLPEKVINALKIKIKINKKRPAFKRQNWFRYKRLARTGWRRPRGVHSKQRRHYGYRPPVVSIGYGSPSIARHIHPSGFKEVMVYNPKDLEKVDKTIYAVRIGHSVVVKKRLEIEKKASEMHIKVLNKIS